jgi:xanthine dehydrogenase accessory factor
MRRLLAFILSELRAGRPVAGAVIVSATGSTPRSTGSRMAVAADGRACGTVGGGPAEARAAGEAEKALSTGASRLIRIDLTAPEAAASGMICGGILEILVEVITADLDNIRLFTRIQKKLWQGEKALLYTVFRKSGRTVEILGRGVDAGQLPPGLPIELSRKIQCAAEGGAPRAFQEDGHHVLIEPFSFSGSVLIAGAGHVGRATAALTPLVGFETVVIDDRPEFLVTEGFPEDCRLQTAPPGFPGCFEGIRVDEASRIVILTRGHVHDQTVLAQALQTPAGYIGMIGSRRKRDAIYERLRKEGTSSMALDRVHCPIGLDIGAETPEEIAVSIVAELIRHRAKGRGL